MSYREAPVYVFPSVYVSRTRKTKIFKSAIDSIDNIDRPKINTSSPKNSVVYVSEDSGTSKHRQHRQEFAYGRESNDDLHPCD